MVVVTRELQTEEGDYALDSFLGGSLDTVSKAPGGVSPEGLCLVFYG